MTSDLGFTLSAPGKIILIGEHSVVYKKIGVAVSLDKRTKLIFKERKEAHDQISISLPDLASCTVWDFKSVYDFITRDKPLICEADEFSIDQPELVDHEGYMELVNEFISGKFNDMDEKIRCALLSMFYVIGVMLWCSKVDLCPFDIEVKSDLGKGGGTGSSAAFSVCVAAAFYHYMKMKALQEHGSGDVNICNEKFRKFIVSLEKGNFDLTYEDKSLVNRWAFNLEKLMHGRPSGLDNTVCTFGSAVIINSEEMQLKENQTSLLPLKDIPFLEVLLIDTGVERRTGDQVKKVAQLREKVPEVVDSVLSAMNTVAMNFLDLLKKLSSAGEPESADIYQRIECLIDISHGLLRSLDVSHLRLDEACYITLRRGLHTKLTGAGGGGYAFTLINPHTSPETVNAVNMDLESAGFKVQRITLGGPGLRVDH